MVQMVDVGRSGQLKCGKTSCGWVKVVLDVAAVLEVLAVLVVVVLVMVVLVVLAAVFETSCGR